MRQEVPTFPPTSGARLTIGPDIYQAIIDWSAAAGVAVPLSLLTRALQVRTATQRALYRCTLDALEGVAPILKRWDLNGTQTYGMAALAAAWERRPSFFDAKMPARIAVDASSDKEYSADVEEGVLSVRHDALFFMMQRPYPFGAANAPHRRLRAWALLHGLRLFLLKPVPDLILARICKSLAQAALEEDTSAWHGLVLKLGASTDCWEEINQRLKRPEDALGGQTSELQPTHKIFLTRVRRLANFENDPFSGSWPGSDVFGREEIPWSEYLEHQKAVDALAAEDPEQPVPRPAPLALSRTGDQDDEELAVYEVDPEQTAEEQDRHIQSIRFRIGAAARFLPWDWSLLSPPEREDLDKLVHATLEHPTSSKERTLAALVSVALSAGMSLEEVALIPSGSVEDADSEWRIDLARGLLVRAPPRRPGHWRPQADTKNLVTAAATSLSFAIPVDALGALRAAQSNAPSVLLLGQIWPDRQSSIRGAFRAWVKQGRGTARLQSSMLARSLGQTAFEKTHDHVLARLLASNRASVLPSSTVYTAYHSDAIAPFHPRLVASTQDDPRLPINAAGSLLEAVDDDLACAGFHHARELIERHRRANDPIQFHNAVALYWDSALRAATGARPVSGLWRSVHDFDWEHSEVFIDDKASPIAETGRLVPLPTQLCRAFKSLYVDSHLPRLLSELGSEPHGRARAEHVELPSLLFILEPSQAGLRFAALENRHRGLPGDPHRIESKLPLNFFRHRLRTKLHSLARADLEIVDSILGHSDGATLTHGDFSMRVWRQDSESIRPAITMVFDLLGFRAPPLWSSHLADVDDLKVSWTSTARPNRRRTKEDRLAHQRHQADQIIRAFVQELTQANKLEGTALDDASQAAVTPDGEMAALICQLTEDQIAELSHRLIADGQGMPSSTGALRYERLLQLAGTAWTENGRRARIGMRYDLRPIEPTPFTPLAPKSLETRALLCQALETMFEREGERSRISVLKAQCLAVYDLALFSRITHHDLLRSVIVDDHSWRIVRLLDAFYIEWSPSDDLFAKPAAPIQRFAISMRSAWLLQHRIRGAIRRESAWAASHDKAGDLVTACADQFAEEDLSTADELLASVLLVVGQANAIELPGAVAAYLSGRVCGASLGWGDWVRLRCGRWVSAQLSSDTAMGEETPGGSAQASHAPELPEDTPLDFELTSATHFSAPASDAEQQAEDLILGASTRAAAAFELIKELRRSLRQLAAADGSKHRTNAADKLAREIHSKAQQISSAIQLLCLWAIDLLLRPGRSRKLATSSVLRYFTALSPRFQSIGYAVDLAAMEALEVEEFYAAVIDGSTVENLKDTYDGLRNFHRFAQMAAGLPEIDWSVLAVGDRVQLGSAGLVDEATYIELLHRLAQDGDDEAEGWQLQCIALLAFRFGLRGGEATGLRRSDLFLTAQPIRVVVQGNRLRKLKTHAARRVVPLLFELQPIELRALAHLAAFHDCEAVGTEDPPAFASRNDPSRPIDGIRARTRVNEQLQSLTGQATSTMHKLRKGFATRVWIAVESPGRQFPGLSAAASDSRIPEVLLGTKSPKGTRRGSWAVASIMGHAHPATTFRSYLHILSDVAIDLAAPAPSTNCLGLTADKVKVVALDRMLAPVELTQVRTRATRPASPADALRALIYMSRGRTQSEAAEYTLLDIDLVRRLHASAEAVYERLAYAEKERLLKLAREQKSSRLGRHGLLRLLHVNAHSRLRAGLASLSDASLDELQQTASIPHSDWEGVIGPRREFSMWRQEHFSLIAIAARQFIHTESRLKMLAPLKPPSGAAMQRVQAMAVHAGWLPATGTTIEPALPSIRQRPLCKEVEPSSRLPAVSLEQAGLSIDARLVLRIGDVNARDNACDSIEFAAALVCLDAFSQARNPNGA